MKTLLDKDLKIRVGNVVLSGTLVIPESASALVIFSHGSGSSRFSQRNKFVSNELNGDGLASLLVDLLTPGEDTVYENRFNIKLLTSRLVEVTRHFSGTEYPMIQKIGYFGASTGAASALMAAAELPSAISAVVSRGGRPDLAYESLEKVVAPTLLIVGGNDFQVIEFNEQAYAVLTCEKNLQIVQGATHLFEEPGALEQVAFYATKWFGTYLS